MINEILPFPPFTLLVVLFPFGGIPRQTSSKLRFSGAELCEFGHFLVSRSIKKRQGIILVVFLWSGKRDSNSRRLPWQGNALPLSHSRIGGNNRARTYDPLLVRQMLSQLSYAPVPLNAYILYQISFNIASILHGVLQKFLKFFSQLCGKHIDKEQYIPCQNAAASPVSPRQTV